MSKKMDIYKKCCIEIMNICELAPGWRINVFIKDEEIDIKNGFLLYELLKKQRQQLELVSDIIADDIETAKIMEEGMRIHSLIIKEQMYGSEED